MNATLQKNLNILSVLESNSIFDSLTTFEKMELAIAIGGISPSTDYAATITAMLVVYHELDAEIGGHLSQFQKFIIASNTKIAETGGSLNAAPVSGSAGVAATGTLTIGGETNSDILAGDVITIWKIALTAVAADATPSDYEFCIDTDKDEVIANIVAAIEAIPGGSVLPFTAAAGTSPTIVITAKAVGVAGNTIATSIETEGTTAFAATTLESGVDAVASSGGALGSIAVDGTKPYVKTSSGYERVPKVIFSTPVNAVAASKLLTINTKPAEGSTVTVGAKTYKFRVAIGAGAAASKNLTFTGVAVNANTVTIGTRVYTFKTALSTGPTVPNEVLVEATAEGAVDNLIAAINAGAGAGTKYSTGTLVHADVAATKSSTNIVIATAKVIGFAGNSIAVAQTCTNATWAGGATALSGGIDAFSVNDVLIGSDTQACIDNLVLAITAGAGAGTNYATGTTVNTTVTAVKASAATMTATAKTKGVAGNSLVVGETLADGSWASAATTLSGGVDGTIAYAGDIYINAGAVHVALADNTIVDANFKTLS